ncbi:MAG: glutamate--cysteine ligase [Planctomycetes bacterium]|nr:glutamate--cysteine ligase [Planctomycetota bacterium]
MSNTPFHLFEVFGLEIERMIVDAATLDVRPIVDSVLQEAAEEDTPGSVATGIEDIEDGSIGWSNELVGHVVELKNAQPVASLAGVAEEFTRSTRRLAGLCSQHDARLMPTAMHPWMNPRTETRIWPHESSVYYLEYDRLYDCHRHGWSNLQSVHLNLPFATDEEFSRLLAAIRIVLPLIPALSASSPIVEGRATGRLDNRLDHYRTNAARTPSMAGEIIVEPIFEPERYHAEVLAPVAVELREIGASAEMQGREWTNARGAIARFDRMAIEVRLIDAQECNRADVGVAALVSSAVRMLTDAVSSTHDAQRRVPQAPLLAQFERCIAAGPAAALESCIAESFGDRKLATAGDVWSLIAHRHFDGPSELEAPIEVILQQGTLAERLLRALGTPASDEASLDRSLLADTYRRICDALIHDESFCP